MAFRSVIDVDIQDEKFKKFVDLFQKYQEQLKQNKGAWAGINKQTQAAAATVEDLVAATAAQNQMMNQLARSSTSVETSMDRTRKHVAAISTGLAEATRHILRIGGVGGIVGGLLGVGGLWGLDRLGSGAAARRREAIGLGASYGGLASFGASFGRAVDPSSILAGISAVQGDPSRMGPYAAIGMSAGELKGDSSEVAARYLSRLRQFAQRTSPSLLGTMSDALGLGETGVSVEDLRRLRSMSGEEFSSLQSRFGKGQSALGLSEGDQRAWQDFTTQMRYAGEQINNVFVRGLSGLATPLSNLSSAFANTVSSLLGSEGFNNLIKEAGGSLQHLAEYLGTPEFEKNVKDFAHDIGVLASAVASAVHWLSGRVGGTVGGASANTGAQAPPNMSFSDSLLYALDGKQPVNNPFNLREVQNGKMYTARFRQFGSVDDSIRATADQLRRDEYVHHQTTLRQLIYGNSEWAGYTSTDRAAYLSNVSKWTGIGADQPLNLNNVGQLSNVMSSFSRQEGHTVAKDVIVKVLVEPGSNVISVANQASYGG